MPGAGGGVPGTRGVSGGDPPRRLLLQAVRILLECILVHYLNRFTWEFLLFSKRGFLISYKILS